MLKELKELHSYFEDEKWNVFSYYGNFYIVLLDFTIVIPIKKAMYNKLYKIKLNNDEISKMSIKEIEDLIILKDNLISSQIIIAEKLSAKLNLKEMNILKDITIEITEDCNLRCSYCYGSFGNTRSKTLEENIAKQIVDCIFEYPNLSKNLRINFFGGEPLLKFNLIADIVDYIEEKKNDIVIQYGITTNGTILTDEIIEFFRRYNFYVLVSSDGVKICNDQNRKYKNGNGSFETINKNLISLSRNKIPVKALMILTPYSVRYFSENIKYFDSLGVKSISSNPFYHSSGINISPLRYNSQFEIFEYHLKELTKIIIRKLKNNEKFVKYEELHIFVRKILNINNENCPVCMAVFGSSVFIDNQGDFYPCTDFKCSSSKFKIGCIKTGFNFNKINLYMKKMKNTNELIDCKNCLIKNICAGLCLSQHVRINNDYNETYTYYSTICNYKIAIFKAACYLMEKLNSNQLKAFLEYDY